MTAKEKKELIEKRLKEGDKRSYWQIVADLELQIWTDRHKGQGYFEKLYGRLKNNNR
jgi:hypothetical protein